MKNKRNIAIALGFLLLPFATQAQTNLTVTGTSQTFFGKTICSGNSADNPKITVTTTFTQSLTPSTGADIFIQELSSTGTVLSETNLTAQVTAPPGGSRSSANWRVDFGNSSIVTTFEVFGSNTQTKTINFNRKDGNYRFRVVQGTTSGGTIQQLSLNFLLYEGAEPWVRVTAANASVLWTTNLKRYNVLKGCTNNDPRIRVNPNMCGNDAFYIKIGEYNMATGSYVGSAAERSLTSGEVTDLLSGTGIKINGFSGNGQTISLATNKHYHITVVYVGQNTWKEAYSMMFYKDGDFDLTIPDNASYYDGFEPVDKWDDNIFASPDLWNKLYDAGAGTPNPNPNTKSHDNPTHATIAGNHNRLLVQVRNVGCAASPANVPLRLFWTRARTDELWSDHWLYDPVNNAYDDPINPSTSPKRPAGSEITIAGATMANPYNTSTTPFLLPTIAPGGVYTMPFADGVQWFPPDPSHYDATSGSLSSVGNHPVICLLARIDEPSPNNAFNDPIRYEPTGTTDKITPYVKENNNVATRNTIVISNPNFFMIKPGGGWDYGFATVAVDNDNPTPQTVNLCVDQLIDAGTLGSFADHGTIEVGTTSSLFNAWLIGGSQSTNMLVASPTLFVMTNGVSGCIENITLPPHSREQIGLRFNYDGANLPPSPLEYVYQLSQNSGSSEVPVYGSNSIFIAEVPTTTPTPAPPPLFKPASVNDVSAQDALTVYPNPSKEFVDVTLADAMITGVLNIYDIQGRLVKSDELKNSVSTVRINVSEMPSGNYMIILTDQNGLSHQGRFVKE
jgi:hypothetical protein